MFDACEYINKLQYASKFDAVSIACVALVLFKSEISLIADGNRSKEGNQRNQHEMSLNTAFIVSNVIIAFPTKRVQISVLNYFEIN